MWNLTFRKKNKFALHPLNGGDPGAQLGPGGPRGLVGAQKFATRLSIAVVVTRIVLFCCLNPPGGGRGGEGPNGLPRASEAFNTKTRHTCN